MAGIFSKIFGSKDQPGPPDPLGVILADMDTWEAGLVARAVAYVRENDGRPVLLAIGAARQAHRQAQQQGTQKYLDHRASQEKSMRENAMLCHFGGQPEALARYVEVLTAMNGRKPYRNSRSTDFFDATPDVVYNLLALLRPSQSDVKDMVAAFGPTEPTTFADVLAAVRVLGGSGADIISMAQPASYGAACGPVEGRVMSALIHRLPVEDFIVSFGRRSSRDLAAVLKRLEGSPVAKDPGLLDFLIENLSSGSAQVRAAVGAMLAHQDSATVEARVIPMLDKGAVTARGAAVQVLGAIDTESARAAMAARLESEKSQEVITAINHYLGAASEAAEIGEGVYLAHDGSTVSIPDVAPLVDDGTAPFDDADRAILRDLEQKRYEMRLAKHANQLAVIAKSKDPKRQRPEKPVPENLVVQALDMLNKPIDQKYFGPAMNADDRRKVFFPYYDQVFQKWYEGAFSRMSHRRLVDICLMMLGDVIYVLKSYHVSYCFELLRRLDDGEIDIQQVLAVARERGVKMSVRTDHRTAATFEATDAAYVRSVVGTGPGYYLAPTFASGWPMTARTLNDVLSAMPPRTQDVHANTRALRLLADLPKLPAAAVDIVLFAALDPRRKVSGPAQALLADVEGIDGRVIETLADKRQAVRGKAASFLADRGVTAAVAPLVKALKTEKSESARADMIAALAALGGDTGPYLGRAALTKEAKGYAAKLPNAKIDWLVAGTMPALKWADGTPVDADIPDGWLRLALKLKTPGGSPLFGMFFDQLDPATVREFSDWVLNSWIAYDTYKPAVDELRERAMKEAAVLKAKHTWYAKMTVDAVAAMLILNWRSSYANSGTEAKGILALTHRAAPGPAATKIAAYLKEHGKRVSNAKCLVEVLAATGTPEALQVLVATATRFKQRTVRELAEACVADIAEARGWTEDELADRSVPSGGFEEDGVMPLDVGEQAKPYTARLGSDLGVKLFNPDGKEVKSIPAGKDENTKESKALLSAAKATVKAVTAQQTARLYDAMIGGRRWPLADWQADIAGHPILSRLVERVVWRGLDADGDVAVLFRPTPEGDRLTADGDDADLGAVTAVDIAHTATVTEDVRQAWMQHLADFEVQPLFAQISRPMQALDAAQAKATAITDRQGWLTDAFKLRAAAEKAGFERGPVEDGAGFYIYLKTFRNAGIRAELHFSGSYLPEEAIPVAIRDMQFFKAGRRARGGAMPLAEVPGMVLSEAWNDLHDIASVGAFDADWQKKGLH